MPPPALYAARVRDLFNGRSVAIECECGHIGMVPVWLIGQRLDGVTRLLDIAQRCRCRACHNRGRVRVDAMRALGHDRRNDLP
jgi:hypothetical protein